jgi:hypothetical protein
MSASHHAHARLYHSSAAVRACFTLAPTGLVRNNFLNYDYLQHSSTPRHSVPTTRATLPTNTTSVPHRRRRARGPSPSQPPIGAPPQLASTGQGQNGSPRHDPRPTTHTVDTSTRPPRHSTQRQHTARTGGHGNAGPFPPTPPVGAPPPTPRSFYGTSPPPFSVRPQRPYGPVPPPTPAGAPLPMPPTFYGSAPPSPHPGFPSPPRTSVQDQLAALSHDTRDSILHLQALIYQGQRGNCVHSQMEALQLRECRLALQLFLPQLFGGWTA